MSGILFIISAPSGSGKTTLTNELLRLVPGLEFSISYTTRPPRGSEQDGRDYHFITGEQFEGMLRQDAFLEHADVFGHCYGTAKRVLDEASAAHKDLVLDIDVQGAAQVKAKMPGAVSIFILPPSRQVLETRLRHRSQAENANFEDVIRRRLAGARKEIENYGNYDYILVNDRLEDSIEQLKAIVSAERLRHCHTTPSDQAAEIARQAERCRLENVRLRAEKILRSFDEPGAAP